MSGLPEERNDAESKLVEHGPRIQSGEMRSVIYALCWMFCVLLGYFIIRPLRETLGSMAGTVQLQRLFVASFLVMIVLVPLYAALLARLPRRWIVRVVFHLFAICLVVFSILLHSDDGPTRIWAARVLFVWISVFGVFSTSVFWSVLADLFSSRQGRRLFGIIASGGTAGAITGSLFTSQLADRFSMGSLLLIPALVIEIGLWFAWRLERQATSIREREPEGGGDKPAESEQLHRGGLWAGVTHVLQSPYLASICAFLFFVQGFGTLLYFEQAEVVKEAIPEESRRTELFAYLDLGTQVLTLLIQLSLSGVILRRLGVSFALVLLPIVYLGGFAILAADPSLSTLVVVVILSRGVGYGITVPTREVLFTVVEREDKYKSKSFIDTVVLRGGDTIAGQIVSMLRVGAGVSLTQLNLWVLPIVTLWAALSWQLGRRQQRLAAKPLPMAIAGHRQGQEENSGERNH